MTVDFLLMALGLLGLFYGGNFLVEGSTGLSFKFGLSPLIVGMTVIAFGTSAPELLVSLSAALSGHGDIAYGNVVGSNIANILLILGVPALFTSINMVCEGTLRAWVEMMFATLLFWFLLQFEPFGFWQGAVLLSAFVIILTSQIFRADDKTPTEEIEEKIYTYTNFKIAGLILLGLILLPLGAQLLVNSAVNIATEFNIPEAVIGLSIVAIGTSLPELAASVSAAMRGNTDLAVGNVIGSCLFNILLILGSTALLSSTTVDPNLIRYNVPLMAGITLVFGVLIYKRVSLGRFWGVIFILAYILYLFSLV